MISEYWIHKAMDWSNRGLIWVLYGYLHGWTEENLEKPHSEQVVSGPRFEPHTSKIQNRSANHFIITVV
jgi:hypothetical protein